MRIDKKNSLMQRKVKCIHFVGIGGIGMSGIAEVLVYLGYISAAPTFSPRKQRRDYRRLLRR